MVGREDTVGVLGVEGICQVVKAQKLTLLTINKTKQNKKLVRMIKDIWNKLLLDIIRSPKGEGLGEAKGEDDGVNISDAIEDESGKGEGVENA